MNEDIVFFEREWVYPANKYDGTHYISEITVNEHWCNASMTISDGNEGVYLDLDFDETENYEVSIMALTNLINGLTKMKEIVMSERVKWVENESKRKEEQRERVRQARESKEKWEAEEAAKATEQEVSE